MEFKEKIYYSKVLLAGISTLVCNLLTILAYFLGFGHAQAFGVAFGWGILIPYYFLLSWRLNEQQITTLGGKKKIFLEGIGGYVFFWVSTWGLSYTFLHYILWPQFYTRELLGAPFFKSAPYYLVSLAILGISFALTMTSSIISIKVMDVKRLARYSKEIKKFKELEKEVKQTGDKKGIIKLKRKQKYIEKITRTVMKQRLKPMAVYFVPFLILYIFLSSYFGNATCAMFPFNIGEVPLLNMFIRGPVGVYIPMGYPLGYVSWYIISSFGFTTIIQKALGLRFDQ